MATTVQSDSDRQWYIVGRWQEFEGEGRANLLRIVAVGVFYGLQLVQHHFFAEPGESEQRFHQAATALAAVGVLLSLGVQLCLACRFFPAALKYITTATDLVLISAVALLGSGANSPFRIAYFVVIPLATLRFNLPLVWYTTLGSMLAYLALVGATDKTWFDEQHAVPPIEQLLILASLGLTGVVMGQVIRRVRRIAEIFSERHPGFTKPGAVP